MGHELFNDANIWAAVTGGLFLVLLIAELAYQRQRDRRRDEDHD